MSVYVRLDVTVRLDFSTEPKSLTKKVRQEAIEAALDILPEFGTLRPVTKADSEDEIDFRVEADDTNVTEVWQEE